MLFIQCLLISFFFCMHLFQYTQCNAIFEPRAAPHHWETCRIIKYFSRKCAWLKNAAPMNSSLILTFRGDFILHSSPTLGAQLQLDAVPFNIQLSSWYACNEWTQPPSQLSIAHHIMEHKMVFQNNHKNALKLALYLAGSHFTWENPCNHFQNVLFG